MGFRAEPVRLVVGTRYYVWRTLHQDCGQTVWRLWKHNLPVVLRTRAVNIKVWLAKKCSILLGKIYKALVELLSFILEMEEIMNKTEELFVKMSKKKGIRERLTRIIKAGSDEAEIQNLRGRLSLLSETTNYLTLVPTHIYT